MKIENYQFNKSSFLSVEKDMSLIVNKILKNERLKKLLYYPTRDALHRESLSEEESIGLLGEQIKNLPKVFIDSEVKNYLSIFFTDFTPNYQNPEFRDNTIVFNIICHYDSWSLEDFQQRPYRIAAEIDQMFNNKHLSGIGTLDFIGAAQIVINDEFAGLTMQYRAIHGEEDKIHPLNPRNADLLYGVD